MSLMNSISSSRAYTRAIFLLSSGKLLLELIFLLGNMLNIFWALPLLALLAAGRVLAGCRPRPCCAAGGSARKRAPYRPLAHGPSARLLGIPKQNSPSTVYPKNKAHEKKQRPTTPPKK
jgi:hypothetical protein